MVSDTAEWSKEIQTGLGNLKVVAVEKRKPDCGGWKVSGKCESGESLLLSVGKETKDSSFFVGQNSLQIDCFATTLSHIFHFMCLHVQFLQVLYTCINVLFLNEVQRKK